MNDKDIQYLMDLADKNIKAVRTKEEALQSLMHAGILDANGNFTKPYADLGKALKSMPAN
ncbi:MAG: hypothetical protein V4543_12075 [Bacteroidota bacterium]